MGLAYTLDPHNSTPGETVSRATVSVCDVLHLMRDIVAAGEATDLVAAHHKAVLRIGIHATGALKWLKLAGWSSRSSRRLESTQDVLDLIEDAAQMAQTGGRL